MMPGQGQRRARIRDVGAIGRKAWRQQDALARRQRLAVLRAATAASAVLR